MSLEGSRRRRRKSRRDPLRNPNHYDYRLYINKSCKKIKKDPRTRMSGKYAKALNSVINRWIEKISIQAGKVCRASGRKTLSISHIRKAICIKMPPEVAERAVKHLNRSLVSLAAIEHQRELRRLH